MNIKEVLKNYYDLEEYDIEQCRKHAEKQSGNDVELFSKLFEDTLEGYGLKYKDIIKLSEYYTNIKRKEEKLIEQLENGVDPLEAVKELEEDEGSSEGLTSNNTGIDSAIGMNKRNPKYELNNLYK